MTAKEKYKKLFGSIETLATPISWTNGISAMMEHFAWGTSYILGISKTKLIKLVIEMCDSEEFKHLTTDNKIHKINAKLKAILESSEETEKYTPYKSGYCSAREALRRSLYFSEDYLNIEFNIFLSLCSDRYINQLYKQFIPLNESGTWSTHGNGGLFQYSTNIEKMQMDNLAYNASQNILVANELKLGGEKNKDQILKYCYLYRELNNKNFIQKDTQYLLLFISDKEENFNLEEEILKEIDYAKKQSKLAYLLDKDILDIANNLNINSISWNKLVEFNEKYLTQDDICQVESKLITGFNSTLQEKAFMQKQ